MWRTALDVVRDRPTLFGMSEAIMCWIHREFRHDVGATQVNPQLEEAFVCRHGVCQDFAHIMLGLCRAVGIPARYASGYLYEGPRGAGTGAQGAHAWAEVHLPEVGWIGFDPSRGQLVDERYIKVATGRDYDDVAPVKGSYRGTGQCRMSVTVEVEKQAD
jgi:transglutaminase-like putative cysteine protease